MLLQPTSPTYCSERIFLFRFFFVFYLSLSAAAAAVKLVGKGGGGRVGGWKAGEVAETFRSRDAMGLMAENEESDLIGGSLT